MLLSLYELENLIHTVLKVLATPGDPLQVTLVSIADVPYRLLSLLLLHMGQFCYYVTFKSVIFEFRKAFLALHKEVPLRQPIIVRIKGKITTCKYL